VTDVALPVRLEIAEGEICEWCHCGNPAAALMIAAPHLRICEWASRSTLKPIRVAPAPPVHARPAPSQAGFVYFIQEGARGKVKIGWAKTPTSRLALIQAGNARRLHLRKTIEAADRYYEHQLHAFYAEHRVVREWFDPCVLEIDPPLEARASEAA
jgi:hypothetical protein